jgi:hypothetical protein
MFLFKPYYHRKMKLYVLKDRVFVVIKQLIFVSEVKKENKLF